MLQADLETTVLKHCLLTAWHLQVAFQWKSSSVVVNIGSVSRAQFSSYVSLWANSSVIKLPKCSCKVKHWEILWTQWFNLSVLSHSNFQRIVIDFSLLRSSTCSWIFRWFLCSILFFQEETFGTMKKRQNLLFLILVVLTHLHKALSKRSTTWESIPISSRV